MTSTIAFTKVCIATALLTAPVLAEIDLAGNWDNRWHEDYIEIAPGPDVVDYLGLPINDESRAKALSYSASVLSLPERQCLYYTPEYLVGSPIRIKIRAEADPVTGKTVAWKISGTVDRSPLTIWMDGRPHPSPNAPHTFAGFTTGEWEGDTLTTFTTHMKAGYLRRNGVPLSDQATLTEHIFRHGDTLTIVGLTEDPVYLTEPFILTRTWRLDPSVQITPTPSPCTPEVEVARLSGGEGAVPHYLPDRNPFTDEVTKMYRIPAEAVLGGAETMYPEFRKKLKDTYVAPEKCVRYCCGWGGNTAGLGCVTGGR